MDADVLDRLRVREPIFHHPELGATRADFDAQILEQPGPRRTRRATIWRATGTGWQALYHQGTVMADGA